ncbi:1136_t:CDS:2 [Racocetra fulgida]|uniref:1136_t:CDS:1 n=1 Tax=Racocetra fulgida TaxID=60492 RepID=A0A9N8YXJ1_9GLOM|nr:1136_t:CDS:2 [Racocetra fulgida]
MQQQTYNGLPPEYIENRAERKIGGWHIYNGYNFANLKVNELSLKIRMANHRSYPTNFALLAAFTLAESYTVGTVG